MILLKINPYLIILKTWPKKVLTLDFVQAYFLKLYALTF